MTPEELEDVLRYVEERPALMRREVRLLYEALCAFTQRRPKQQSESEGMGFVLKAYNLGNPGNTTPNRGKLVGSKYPGTGPSKAVMSRSKMAR